MALIWNRFRPEVKPPVGSQLDPGHPLAKNLLAFFAFNGDAQTPQNAAMPGQKWHLQNTPPTFVDTPYGPSPKFDGSSNQAYIFDSAAGAGTPVNELQPLTLPLSFAVLLNPQSLASVIEIFFAGINPVNGDIGGLFCNIFSSKFNIGYGNGLGSSSTENRTILSNTTLSTNTWYLLSGSLRGPTDMSIYINGIDDAGVLGGTGTSLGYPPSGNANSSIGYGGSAAVGTNAIIAWLGYWSRNLTADEHLELAKSGPFKLFARRKITPAPITKAILSQEAIETLLSGQAVARLSQEAIETLVAGQGKARSSQNAVEILHTHTVVAGVLSQYAVEVLVQNIRLDRIPFIASHTVVYSLAVQNTIRVPFITSHTTLYGITVTSVEIDVPFIGPTTVIYGINLIDTSALIDVPFIPSHTTVFGVFSVYSDFLASGVPGNGGEMFLLKLARNGSPVVKTLDGSITSTGDLIQLNNSSGIPTSGAFMFTIDDEVLHVTPIGGNSYRVKGRAMSNTTAASHTSGATVTWQDYYDMAIVSENNIDESFTADITDTGSYTYPGWLICFDSTQAYIDAVKYPMHVTSVLGVFAAGAGSTGTNKCDSDQPNAVCVPFAASNNCPSALSVPSRIAIDIVEGDVALVRYQNPSSGSILTLGSRSAALQSWFGMERVSDTNVDVTFTDVDGNIVDGSVYGVWDNPLGEGIAPDTGLTTTSDVPYTSVTLPGDDRFFTYGSPHYSDKGWPICALSVRQGRRRIPKWKSWDWRNYNFIYSGWDTDATYCQLVVNRNGIIFGSVPEVALPGPQDIDGPDAVWDDGSYQFAAAWYVAIYNAPYLVFGPSLGGSPSEPGGGAGYVPIVVFPGGGADPVTYVPVVEGGSGGGISPPGGGLTGSLQINRISFRAERGDRTPWSPPPEPIPPPIPPPPDPPPPGEGGSGSGMGFVEEGSATYVSTLDDYELYMTDMNGVSVAATLQGHGLRTLLYRSMLSINTGYDTSIPWSQANSNGWLLRDSGGALIYNSGFPSNNIGDPTKTAYSDALAAHCIALCTAYGFNGIWFDDIVMNARSLLNTMPAGFTQTSWRAALVSHVNRVGTALTAAGLISVGNANGFLPGDSNSDTGLNTKNFWIDLTGLTGYTAEYWEQDPSTPTRLRTLGPAYYQHWDTWRTLHTWCNGAGKGFYPLVEDFSSAAANYMRGSFLLDYTGGDSTIIFAQRPPRTFFNLGAASGAAVESPSGVWTRNFANGTVVVNSNTGVATIS